MTAKKTSTKKPATNKATRAKPDATPPATTPPSKPKKVSALSAAAEVLANATEPMTTKDLIAAMTAAGTWTSPGGKTPEATLSAAIGREIVTKGDASRFRKTAPGRYTANASVATTSATEPEPAKKPKGKKAPKAKPTIADGTPGPESMSELFRF